MRLMPLFIDASHMERAEEHLTVNTPEIRQPAVPSQPSLENSTMENLNRQKETVFSLVQVKGTWKRKAGQNVKQGIKGRVSAAKMCV